MVTVEKVKNWVSRISYKPGFKFKVYDRSDLAAVEIMMETKRPDSIKYDGRIDIVPIVLPILIPYEFSGDELGFLGMMQRAFIDAEFHEINEWFRFDGIHVNPPH